MTAQTADLRSKSPETLVQFLKLLLMGMLKRLPLKLLLAGGIALLAWIIHTYLLVVSNEGFNAGNNVWLDRILALQGRTITGSLVWTLMAGLITSTIARIWAYGFGNTIRGVVDTPRHIWNWANELGIIAIPFLIAGYLSTIFFGFFVNNNLLIIQIWLVVLGIVIARHTSLLLTILRLGWSDAQKVAKPESMIPFNLAWPGMFFMGVLVGLLAILPSRGILPYVCGCLGFLLLVLISVGLFVRSQGGTQGVVGKKIFIWVLVPALFSLFMFIAAPAFADDGGWQESGGTLSGWLRSPGAVKAVVMGILPAAGSGLGVLLGTAIGSMISIVGTTGLAINPLTAQPTGQPTPTVGRTAEHQANQFQQQSQADPNTLSSRHQPESPGTDTGSGMRSERASVEDRGVGLRSDRADHDIQSDQSRTGHEAAETGPGQRDTRGVDPQSSLTPGSGSGSAAESADRVTHLEQDKPTDQLSDRHRPDRNQPGGLTERKAEPGQLASQQQPGAPDKADGPLADRHQPGKISETPSDTAGVKSADTEQSQLDASRHDPTRPEEGPLSERHDPGTATAEGMRARRFTREQPGPTAERFTGNETLEDPGPLHSRGAGEAEPAVPLPPIPTPPVILGWDLIVIRTPAGSGLEIQQRLPLDKHTRIGRHGAIDIKLLDPKVSRQHAEIDVQADTCTLTDLGSSNGTFINGKRMTAPQALKPGDAIKIGDTYFVVEQRSE